MPTISSHARVLMLPGLHPGFLSWRGSWGMEWRLIIDKSGLWVIL